MSSFLEELQKNTNVATTENGARTNESSLDPLLDFFAMAGAMRTNVSGAQRLFAKAYAADKLGAIRTLFYLRDVRGGQGERNLFRVLLADLKKIDPAVYDKVLHYIPEYGRWDDFPLNETTYPWIASRLGSDERNMAEGKSVSLLAKWLPSENASSPASRIEARKLAVALGLVGKPIRIGAGILVENTAPYRRRITKLRKYIKLLEEQMSAKQWNDIDYSKIPSQAHRKHTKAFQRHDATRYNEFLEAAQKGEVKLNASTLYTYEVFNAVKKGNEKAANAMWANLPDYTNGTDALVIADVSGSMEWVNVGGVTPMAVAVSLALYFAEHNKGIFKDCFMTFSSRPETIRVSGSTLRDKLHSIQGANVGGSTDIEAVFNKILEAAKASGADQAGMPRVLYIISDMEFNQCVDNPSATLFDNAKAKFEAAGLQLPHVVFWNVNARQEQVPATKYDDHVTLISGLSQSTFQYAVGGKSPKELMLDVINSERYNTITI